MSSFNYYNFNKKSNKVLPKISINMEKINKDYPKTDKNLNKFLMPLINKNHQNISKEKNDINMTSSGTNRKYIKHPSLNLNESSIYKRKSFSFSNKNILENKNILDLSTNKKETDLFKSKFHIENKNKINPRLAKRFSVIISRNKINNKLGFSNTNLINFNINDNSLSLKNNTNRDNKKLKTLSNNDIIKNINKQFANTHRSVNKKESNNPFKVEEEDKIFKNKIYKNLYIKKKKKKKKKLWKLSKNPLAKVYKSIPYIMTQLNKVKKLKNDMNLVRYQNTLMDVGSKVLKRDAREKLNEQFIQIRKSTEKKYHCFEEEIESIERKEKKIIFKINTQQSFFKKIMIENNKSSLIYGITNKHDNFPRIRFYPTPRKLLYNSK